MTYRSIFKSDLFAEQVVIVTGGGSGIGRCTAHELAALGATVALVGRSADKLGRVRHEIEDDGGSASTHVCDIRDELGVIGMVEEVIARHGRIDGLVNNAGGQYRSALESISTKGFEAVVRNNLTGGFIVMREVYTRWMQHHGGSVVNMIMDVAHGWPNYAHSAAARSGMATLTETAAAEWAANGVRVNSIAPGFIASSGLDSYAPEQAAAIPGYVKKIPMQRFGTEAEVSAVIVFLLSPAAAFVTGSQYRVDGGSPNARQTAILAPAVRAAPYEGFHRAQQPTLLSKKEGSD